MENENRANLLRVHEALQEKGYNPIGQIVGYLLTEDPTYITNHLGARNLIRKIDRYSLLADIVDAYFDDIPVTQTCPTSIWQKQPRPGAIWPTSRQYPRANGRRPQPLVSPFEMPASDFSSAQPVIPLTLRPWTNWEASSGAGKTSPRRRHMKCQRQQPLRQPRRPPQNQ